LPFLIAAGFALLAFVVFYFFVDPEPLTIESLTREAADLQPAANPVT
jgi:hypothetical protein